ncbi:hypothetical protein [Anaerotignum sp.]|uniref:hypothetical protein n=1 Tax=Anaerotignum sp. TaxID=2039241 RepID=UPI00331DF6DE
MSYRSKTPLFLMEMVIMLLVFAISAGICLKIFVEGKRISQESYQLDKACMQAQMVAEYWQRTKGNIKDTAELLQAEGNGSELFLYFDENWNRAEAKEKFSLSVIIQDATAKIIVFDGDQEIFSILSEAVMFGA